VLDLSQWIEIWASGITSSPPTFDDVLSSSPVNTRDQIIQHLRLKVEQLVSIVSRERARVVQLPSAGNAASNVDADEGILAALHNSYVGPGALRSEGPRHDNDHVDIDDIRIAPTHQELICHVPPFLPSTLHGAPHPSPPESAERLLDIQYRLLREELTYVTGIPTV
jgi:hypothetical protein